MKHGRELFAKYIDAVRHSSWKWVSNQQQYAFWRQLEQPEEQVWHVRDCIRGQLGENS